MPPHRPLRRTRPAPPPIRCPAQEHPPGTLTHPGPAFNCRPLDNPASQRDDIAESSVSFQRRSAACGDAGADDRGHLASGCPLSLDRLTLLRLGYWGFDHGVHHGELVVNESAAASLAYAFRLLFAARFPIRRMQVVDDFGGDDEQSMLAGNTSAFNCRIVPGTAAWSQHAYGLAADINPFENPEVSNGDVALSTLGATRPRHA